MKILILIFILVISASCSTPQKKSTAVKTYVDAWVTDYEPENKAYVAAYRDYLNYVEGFYYQNAIYTKFNFYLSTLNNINQLLAHTEMNMPQKYKARYHHWPVQNSQYYLKFKNGILQEQQTRLEGDREKRLKEELGDTIFEQLKIHSESYPNKNKAYTFPI